MTPTTATESHSGPFRTVSVDSMTLSAGQVRHMLREWARWLLQPEPNGPQFPKCFSAESNYRSPQCWDDRNPRPLDPDWKVAWRIEGIVRAMPQKDARVLRTWYVWLGPRMLRLHHDPYEVASRRARIGSAARYAELLLLAETHVREQLTEKT